MAAKYAQHFLVNRHAAERIANALELTPTDVVLEIGPGKGALTQFLLKAKYIAVVEIDPIMAERLTVRYKTFPNLKIFQADILKFDFSMLRPLITPGTSVKVVGNLPYNLTSPILRRLSEWDDWKIAHVMVQKEVGDRLCASVGSSDYGALTAGVNLTSSVERVFDLSETSFDPPPRVKSSIMKLIRRNTPLTDNIEKTQRVIQAAFQQRRKTLLNSLSHGLGFEKEAIEGLLEKLGIDDGLRAERISPQDFVRITEAVSQIETPDQ